MEVISIVGVGVLGGRVGLRVEEGAGWPPSGGLAPSLLGNDGIEGNCALVGKVLDPVTNMRRKAVTVVNSVFISIFN